MDSAGLPEFKIVILLLAACNVESIFTQKKSKYQF